MPTYVKLVDGDALTLDDDYRDVYEKLLAAAWREPCEFAEHGEDGLRQVTVNPAFIVFLRRL